MSSREIAELLECRHDNVKRTIDRLAASGVIVRPPMEDEPEKDALGLTRTTEVFRIGKRDSYVIVAQLSPLFTARLVDRWQEQEAQVLAKPQAPAAIPSTLIEALQLAIDSLKAKEQAEAANAVLRREQQAMLLENKQQAAQVAELAPKAAALDACVGDGARTLAEFARKLDGVNRNMVKRDLHDTRNG